MKILFVENDARFARIAMQQFLANDEVVVVPSLKAAREQLQNSRFDVVLLDYDLDDGKGCELMPVVEKLATRPFVVATSSHETGNAALEKSGADAVCGKMHFRRLPFLLDDYRMR